jgi:hypothetical protein
MPPIMWTAIVHLFRAERVPTLRAVTGSFAQFKSLVMSCLEVHLDLTVKSPATR